MINNNLNLEGKDLILLNTYFEPNSHTLFLKLYDIAENKLLNIKDASMFKGFFYVKKDDLNQIALQKFLNEHNEFEVTLEKKYDGIKNTVVEVYRFESYNVFNVYKKWIEELQIPNQYEYQIKYYESFYLTNQLVPCAIYTCIQGKLELKRYPLNESAVHTLTKMTQTNTTTNKIYNQYLTEYTELLGQPVPFVKRIAIDIESFSKTNKVPDPVNPIDPIICCSFYDNESVRRVIVSKEHLTEKQLEEVNARPRENIDESIAFVDYEWQLIDNIFKILDSYPMVLTFNGDEFDLVYIHERSKRLKELNQAKNPIKFTVDNLTKKFGQNKDPVYLMRSVHIDLYRLFKNRSLHTYGFNNKYVQFGLEPISQALLGDGKLKSEIPLNERSINDLARYCLKDAELTLRLSTYSDELVMKLLFTIARITKASIEDIDRYGISSWARSMLYFEHRRWNMLIPTKEEIRLGKGEGSTSAIIKEKEFRGAEVFEPKPGSYFNVVTLDYASLYPSIVKRYNMSYETINCTHEKCKLNNPIPQTKHHYCTKRTGLTSLIIGVIRDLRVNYFKKLSKDTNLTEDQRDLYDSITQASKVILNGSYGVVGSKYFNLYCLPVAESVTALGRNIITKTKEYAETKLGLNVLYGDTDSLFVHNPNPDQIKSLIEFSKVQFDIDLEVDKEYKLIVFSARKKNYFGVNKQNGKLETKGLTGKKNNIPIFVKNCFNEVGRALIYVDNEEKLELAKKEIKLIVNTYITELRNFRIDLNELTFQNMLTQDVDRYGTVTSKDTDLFGQETITKKGVPIHVKIAEQIQKRTGEKIEEKTFIPYVKTMKGAMLVDEAKRSDIDTDKYIDTIKTAIDPILEVLGIDFDSIAYNTKKQTSLDSMFFKE